LFYDSYRKNAIPRLTPRQPLSGGKPSLFTQVSRHGYLSARS